MLAVRSANQRTEGKQNVQFTGHQFATMDNQNRILCVHLI